MFESEMGLEAGHGARSETRDSVVQDPTDSPTRERSGGERLGQRAGPELEVFTVTTSPARGRVRVNPDPPARERGAVASVWVRERVPRSESLQ